MQDFRASFGARIRARREELELSQEALAEKANLHWTFVSGVERGVRNPGLNTIGRLAEALGWTLDEAVQGLTGTREKPQKSKRQRAR